ncbi:MAG: response regulator [Bacteroidota bacterium]
MTHILLIEDNPGDVRLIQEYLKDAGLGSIRLHHGETLASGRKILYQEAIDIILLDLHVPDSMGFPTFEKLYEEFPDYPFIVLTGLQDSSLGIRAVKKGAQDFLNKNELEGQLLGRSINYAIQRQQLLRRLEHAQRMAKIGNWELHLKTNTLSCSRMVYDIFEKGPGFEFKTLADYLQTVHPEDQREVAQQFQHAYQNAERIQVNHRIILPNYQVKHLSLRGEPEKDASGQLISLLGTIQDVTESKQVEALRKEKELATASAKLRQDFLARTSHEIRTPLNPILLLTNMLLRSELDEQQREQVETIKNAGETLLAVVNDILDLAKIEAGKIMFSSHTFNLRQIFRSIEDIMELNAREKSLELLFEIGHTVPENIVGDTVRLTQIFLNLIGNAIKFTHKGYIRVSASNIHEEEGKCVLEFKVKDTGIGIPKGKLDEIFEGFKQLDVDTNRRYGGTGLGLTIVQQLVQLQGGEIKVESEMDEGSCFTFTLEFEISQSGTPVHTEEIKVDYSQVEGLDILLVEDNPLNQLVTKKLLSDWKIKVDIANNGREAVEMLEERMYDLVFMDLQMPEMNGIEATRVIRNQMAKPTCDVPIVALTANAFTGTDDECLQVGMNDYVSKPIQMKNLYAKIIQHARAKGPDAEPPAPSNTLTPKPNDTPPSPTEQSASIPSPIHTHPSEPQQTNGSTFHQPIPTPVGTSIIDVKDPVINLDYLKEISGGDAGIISKTIQKFLETTPEILNQMDNHLEEGDHNNLGRAAHKLKSSVAFMGIDMIKETILEIERITKTGQDVDQLGQHVTKVRTVLEQGYTELEEALQSFG